MAHLGLESGGFIRADDPKGAMVTVLEAGSVEPRFLPTANTGDMASSQSNPNEYHRTVALSHNDRMIVCFGLSYMP